MHTGNTVKFTDFHDNFSTWQLSFINSAAEASFSVYMGPKSFRIQIYVNVKFILPLENQFYQKIHYRDNFELIWIILRFEIIVTAIFG